MRRNRLLGLWAAKKLGMIGDAAVSHAKEVVAADLEEAGDADLVSRRFQQQLTQIIASNWIQHWLSHDMTTETLMTRLGLLVVIALALSSLLVGHDAIAAGGCGADFYRDAHGRCQFYRAVGPANQGCPIGFIWRNGRCRQNIGNDPFVSTWPNAPSAYQERPWGRN